MSTGILLEIWRPRSSLRLAKLLRGTYGTTRSLHASSCILQSREQSREHQVVPPTANVEEPQGQDVKAQLEVSRRLSVSKFDPDSDPFGVWEMVTLKDLFEARVHFGHKQGMWNREMKPYLYGLRNNVHIINLNTTLLNLRRALNVTGHIAYQHGVIIFVNERPQFEALTMQTALRCKEYFATDWMPGTISNSYKLLKTLRVPDLMLFLSVPRSKTAVNESVTCAIPSVGIVDSDCDPNTILYPVPGNDDSPQAVRLYFDLFCEVILRAKRLRERDEREAEQELVTHAEERKKLRVSRAAALDQELKSIYYGKKPETESLDTKM